jgi:hypothetical protein
MTNQVNIEKTIEKTKDERDRQWDTYLSPIGYILAVSYPVLALSTGVRASYQLFVRHDITNYLPVFLSGVAALCYLIASIGFAYRRRWTWWLSVVVLTVELVMTLVIGVWSILDPPFIGHTVWRHFGEDYGYFPLIQPLLGLVWLLWPQTLRAYGVHFGQGPQGQRVETPVNGD